MGLLSGSVGQGGFAAPYLSADVVCCSAVKWGQAIQSVLLRKEDW